MPPDAITMLPVPSICRTSGFELGRLIKALFSFRVMLAAGLVLIYLLTISNRFSDPDLWFHLKLGQTMWDNHSIPSTDSFSYTAYGHPWTAHEWLAQLSIYTVYRWEGYMLAP